VTCLFVDLSFDSVEKGDTTKSPHLGTGIFLQGLGVDYNSTCNIYDSFFPEVLCIRQGYELD